MKKKNFFILWLKSLGISVAITLFTVLISALMVKNIDSNVKTLNFIMLSCKIVSIIAGSMYLVHGIRKKGFLFGGIFGLVYWAIFFLITVLTKTSTEAFFVFDLVFSIIIGAINGIIWTNVFSKQ